MKSTVKSFNIAKSQLEKIQKLLFVYESNYWQQKNIYTLYIKSNIDDNIIIYHDDKINIL